MTFLHVSDVPLTIAVILVVRDGRDVPGITPEANGLDVDWDELLSSYLSTTEKHAMRLARALAPMEAHGGGYPDRVNDAIRSAVAAVVDG